MPGNVRTPRALAVGVCQGLEKIDHIQVQFHNFVPDFKQKKKLVVEALEQTHTKKWGYENVYESWSLK